MFDFVKLITVTDPHPEKQRISENKRLPSYECYALAKEKSGGCEVKFITFGTEQKSLNTAMFEYDPYEENDEL